MPLGLNFQELIGSYRFLILQADESLSEEVDTALLCKRRLEHLKEGAHLDSKRDSEREDWTKKRVDRMLVEHFLRAGYYE